MEYTAIQYEVRGPQARITLNRPHVRNAINHAMEVEVKDALLKANDTEYGLASYVFTQDAARAQRLVDALHFQHVAWNTGTGPAPEAPFGGMRQSGYGREGGVEGLFEFVDVKTSPMGI